ncbi:MAG: AAA family ATPase, partial [Turicibacter sp.]
MNDVLEGKIIQEDNKERRCKVMKPLAELIRPKTLDEVVGQQHLIAKNQILRNLIEVNHIPNLIFYGPSGTGKTTIANIIASISNKKIYKINATDSG